VTVSSTPSGGPNKDGSQSGLDFLGTPRWTALCIEQSDGTLRCTPAFLRGRDDDHLHLAVPDGQPAFTMPGTGRAALVADEFASYDEIRGVIARGTITGDPPRDAHFQLGRVASFSFQGRTPSALTRPSAPDESASGS
jgi:hypothetical protein